MQIVEFTPPQAWLIPWIKRTSPQVDVSDRWPEPGRKISKPWVIIRIDQGFGFTRVTRVEDLAITVIAATGLEADQIAEYLWARLIKLPFDNATPVVAVSNTAPPVRVDDPSWPHTRHFSFTVTVTGKITH